MNKKAAKPAKITMHPVKSSHIAAVGHDGPDVMVVNYTNGRTYSFAGFTGKEVEDIRKADSVGRALQAAVRTKGVAGTLHQEPKAARG